jgi:hypothetical protein
LGRPEERAFRAAGRGAIVQDIGELRRDTHRGRLAERRRLFGRDRE